MKCTNMVKGKNKGDQTFVDYPCGQCMACRITNRQTWTFRLMMELRQHTENFFVTLTYDEEHLPKGGTLRKRDFQLWIKRLRKRTGVKLRYFGVGEYGNQTGRAHYHALVFSDGGIDVSFAYNKRGQVIIDSSDFSSAWMGNGFVDVIIVPGESDGKRIAQYICGYCLKKLMSENAIEKEYGDGREPEFVLSSRRPGIGLGSVVNIGKALSNYEVGVNGTGKQIKTNLQMARYGGKLWPVGRYLRDKIIEYQGGDQRSDKVKRLLNSFAAKGEVYRELEPGYKCMKKLHIQEVKHSAEKQAKKWKKSKKL